MPLFAQALLKDYERTLLCSFSFLFFIIGEAKAEIQFCAACVDALTEYMRDGAFASLFDYRFCICRLQSCMRSTLGKFKKKLKKNCYYVLL